MTFSELKAACPHWADYTQHDFVRQLGEGRLPMAAFQYYLQQDYRFLQQFARAWALLAYKAPSLEVMRMGQAGLNAVLDTEIGLHIAFSARFGVDAQALERTPESSACVAYTRFVLDAGMCGGVAELYAALLPCMMGYAEIGAALAPRVHDHHPYREWIAQYAGAEFQAAAQVQADFFDDWCASLPQSQSANVQAIFDTATRMEVAFWQDGLQAGQ